MKKNKNNISRQEKVPKNKIMLDGTVIEALPNAMFRVRLDNNQIVLCTVKGKMRNNNKFIRILPDDRVQVGIEVYDLTRGYIYYRY